MTLQDEAMGDTTTWHDDGDGRHRHSNDKGQNGNGRHDNGKGQQGNR